MLQKYIPKTILSCTNYAARSDRYIMRPDAANFGFPTSNELQLRNGMKIYCWSMMVNQLFQLVEKTNIEDLILISGDDDHHAYPNGTTVFDNFLNKIHAIPKFMPKNFKKWYSQNAEIANNTMIPIPIGLCPPWANGISNVSDLTDNIMDVSKKKLVYCNFSKQTNEWKRPQIFEIVTKNLQNNYTAEEYVSDKKSLKFKYYKGIQEHHYILCPPGKGQDTHRTWESIYMGSIPIVEDSPMNRYFAQFFPILVVERWCDITEEFLKSKIEYFNTKTWRYDLLDCDNLFKEYGLQ